MWSQLAWGQLKCSSWMCCKDTSLLIKKKFFKFQLYLLQSLFFFCGWILGSTFSLAGFLGWDWVVWKPCPTVAATLLGAFASVPGQSFWQGFLLTLLEHICEDQKLPVYWAVQILFPRIQAEIHLALSGVNLHFSYNEGVQLYKWFEQLWHSCVWKWSNYACQIPLNKGWPTMSPFH